jgi:hypothetical protein
VYAYKRDCVTLDQIRLVLGDDNRQMWMEVSEGDSGYHHLVTELSRHLTGCPAVDEWWQSVAIPPFEMQWTQLHRRTAGRPCDIAYT